VERPFFLSQLNENNLTRTYEDDEDSNDGSNNSEAEQERQMDIRDQSNTDLVNLRCTIYSTSIDFEECCHKLMKIFLPTDKEPELPSMIIECCSQERTYSEFYGLIGERCSKLNRLCSDIFEESFAKY
jgi:pre-mRNA-splicing factor CWC22